MLLFFFSEMFMDTSKFSTKTLSAINGLEGAVLRKKDKEYNWRRWPKKLNEEGQECQPMDTEWARQILCKAPAYIFTYLENEATFVVGGYKIYGSPCQSAYWAFHRSRGENIARMCRITTSY